MVDIESMFDGAVDKIEKNAALLALLGTSWARVSEGLDVGQAITNIPAELMNDLSVAQLKYKLWDSPHMNTQAFKYAAIAYIAGKYVGLIPPKYTAIAKDVAIGSAISALILPGSGPGRQNVPTTPKSGYGNQTGYL